ncbi:MAG: hypothetical protein ABI658_29150 [Acidimicrobiales bacterium]
MQSMSDRARCHVMQADIAFAPDADTRAPGGAVTVALCGSWEHEGSCRWPHHIAVDGAVTPSHVRVVYVVDDAERDHVRGSIEAALASSDSWSTVAVRVSTLTAEEAALAQRLRDGRR